MAYTSNETGREEIYVVPFPDAGAAKWVVSTGGGIEPRWAPGAGELFLPELVMSAEAMKAALAILEPELAKGSQARENMGNVLACTVQGDIHDIGKRIVCTMLSANGFSVADLGVNVTAGLPVVRTSVDHGTAFDIAGTGKADERSMLEALRQAALLSSSPS